MVVDDDANVRRFLRATLAAHGHVIVDAGTVAGGIEAVARTQPDVILLDLGLPDGDELAILREVRAGSRVPVIVLSARDHEGDKVVALDAGADDYLTKPFSFVVLLAKLRALLRRGTPERPPVLRVGTLSLDPATRRVVRDGEDISLTTREFSLLEYLMRHADRVVTKIELLDHVWDAAADLDPNVVEVYVGYLRRKIGRPLVETVRGAGYRLRSPR